MTRDAVVIRRDRGGMAAVVGLVLVGGPLALGISLLASGPLTVWNAIGVALCALMVYRLGPGVLRLVDRLEVRGDRVRLRRLWTRLWKERTAADVTELVMRAGVEPDGAGSQPRVKPMAYLLGFADRTRFYLDLRAFPGGEAAVAALVRDERAGIAFPLELGGLHLSGAHAFQSDPGLGRSVAYMEPRGTTCTVHIYDRGLADIGRGVTDAVRAELGKAIDEVRSFWKSIAPDADPMELLDDEAPLRLGEQSTGMDALGARLQGSTAGTVQQTRVALSGIGGYFLKVRMTAKDPGAWFDALCERFFREVGLLVARS